MAVPRNPGAVLRFLPLKLSLSVALLTFGLIAGVTPTPAQAASLRAKHFPTGFFYQYHNIPISEKAKVLAKIDATLKKLNRDGYGLVAKGAVIEKLSPTTQTYPQLTILDESGLIIIARHVPNLYYQYCGPAAINPNIYLIIKNVRVNFPESYIRYGYVVAGDYVAYAHKFVDAIQGGLDRAVDRPDLKPARPPR